MSHSAGWCGWVETPSLGFSLKTPDPFSVSHLLFLLSRRWSTAQAQRQLDGVLAGFNHLVGSLFYSGLSQKIRRQWVRRSSDVQPFDCFRYKHRKQRSPERSTVCLSLSPSGGETGRQTIKETTTTTTPAGLTFEAPSSRRIAVCSQSQSVRQLRHRVETGSRWSCDTSLENMAARRGASVLWRCLRTLQTEHTASIDVTFRRHKVYKSTWREIHN